METLEYVLVVFVRIIVIAELLLMFTRAILSWVILDDEGTGGIYGILCYLTEPIVYPVRKFLYKIPAIEEMPLDISFLVTGMILSVILMFI